MLELAVDAGYAVGRWHRLNMCSAQGALPEVGMRWKSDSGRGRCKTNARPAQASRTGILLESLAGIADLRVSNLTSVSVELLCASSTGLLALPCTEACNLCVPRASL